MLGISPLPALAIYAKDGSLLVQEMQDVRIAVLMFRYPEVTIPAQRAPRPIAVCGKLGYRLACLGLSRGLPVPEGRKVAFLPHLLLLRLSCSLPLSVP